MHHCVRGSQSREFGDVLGLHAQWAATIRRLFARPTSERM